MENLETQHYIVHGKKLEKFYDFVHTVLPHGSDVEAKLSSHAEVLITVKNAGKRKLKEIYNKIRQSGMVL